ncbi:thiol-disulfide oxidoreductase DCC family protein [Bacillus xiapuensis]|uniref:thiol-disulfide oxidoreductase DCC family protein n=1 Tax=Bacillus xiapuensis TaxID=2014075 RepID=UPI000C24506A|nr:DUF393 domain-containing protein [Bacillus xiapuensis]
MRRRSLTIFYDSWCPICSKFKKRIESMDTFGLFNFVSFREHENIKMLNVSMGKLEKEMHVLKANGEILSGFDAICAVFARVPFLFWLWPVFKLLKLLGIGDFIYDFIASRRLIIPTGNCDENTCHIKK